MVAMAALLGAQGCGLALRLAGWCQDKWTSSTGILPRTRRDITDTLLKSAFNTKQSTYLSKAMRPQAVINIRAPYFKLDPLSFPV